MNSKVKICCLPKAGPENPYQSLMMEGLRKNPQFEVMHGYDTRLLPFLRTYLKFKPDYIHLDWTNKYYNRKYDWMVYFNIPVIYLELLIIKLFCNVRLVWTMHNLYPHDLGKSGIKFKARKMIAKAFEWVRVFDNSTVKKASNVYEIPESKFRVVPEGSYVNYYPNSSNKQTSRAQLSIDQDSVVFLFFGLIRPYKGILEAIEELKNTNHNFKWKLLIAGKANDKIYLNKIKDLIKNDERFILHDKFIPDNEAHIYFNAADFVLLPFKGIENSGSVILAMGFKKIVIAPKIGVLGSRLIMQQEFLYENSFIELIDKLKRTTPEERIQIGQKNYEEVEKYKWEDFSHLFSK